MIFCLHFYFINTPALSTYYGAGDALTFEWSAVFEEVRHEEGGEGLRQGVLPAKRMGGACKGKWLSLKMQSGGRTLTEQEAGRAGEGEPSRILTEGPRMELKQED